MIFFSSNGKNWIRTRYRSNSSFAVDKWLGLNYFTKSSFQKFIVLESSDGSGMLLLLLLLLPLLLLLLLLLPLLPMALESGCRLSCDLMLRLFIL